MSKRVYNNKKIQELTKEVGSIYKTTKGGDLELVAYKNSRNVTVKFLNTGNVYIVQKDAIEKGLIRDSLEEKRVARDKEHHKRTTAELARIRIEQEKQRRIDLELELEAIKTREFEHKVALEMISKSYVHRKEFGKKYKHPFFGEYEIVGYDSNSTPRCFRVRYLETGFETYANLGTIKKGKVKDQSRIEDDDYIAYEKVKSNIAYMKNREKNLEDAKLWQKNNPDKAQARNRNRRAKRNNVEGTHTADEANALLEAQDYKCANCGDDLNVVSKHLDHVMPIKLGGSNSIVNLQWYCQYCNNSKGGKHPDIWKEVVKNPLWWSTKLSRQTSS